MQPQSWEEEGLAENEATTAFASNRLVEGGVFQVKQLGTQTESTLTLPKSSILQKDTKRLAKTTYPPSELNGRLVWPNPDFNMPAIDMFMLLATTLIALQMTVSTAHTLDTGGVKAFLRCFDSVCRELFSSKAVPDLYTLYFCVPADVYDDFSKSVQSVTGPKGTVLKNKEATDASSARTSQWVLKVE